MFQKVLIANRGVISCRIQRTLRRLGVRSVAICSNSDRESLHALEADEVVRLSGDHPADTYLHIERILAAAASTGAEAIHPGYGFLSESPVFARACEEAGLVFLGPTPQQSETCGLKHVCRELARSAGVPLLEGSAVLANEDDAAQAASLVGYPVILKASAGGGGIGMQVAKNPEEVAERFRQVQRLAQANFGESSVFLEKYIERARHIEVQIFGDGKGQVIALGERDCSVQRRNQKVIEETPAPGLTSEDRQRLHEAALAIGRAVNYRSAGTIEFLWDSLAKQFYFLEVNARLQVEHGVTEEVWGIDLVEWMVKLGAGELPPLAGLAAGLSPRGHALQARIYAEDPHKKFQPSTGLVTAFHRPGDVRCDTWIESGTEVSAFYDPMLALVIVGAETRESAVDRLAQALGDLQCHGIETNQAYLRQILASPEFRAGEVTTRHLDSIAFHPDTIDVLDGGLETTVQDYPGRTGFWDVGVPPSGPYDGLSFRLGNLLLGNPPDTAGLELTFRGGSFRFNAPVTICLTGADMGATLDGKPVPLYTLVEAPPGATLALGKISGPGQRTYLLIAGGLDIPAYLGSRATFRLGRFGGHGGRPLRAGDVLRLARAETRAAASCGDLVPPVLSREWDLRVVYGPHGAPDFFTLADIEAFFAADWEVHYNSDRTGIRLIGPKPEWARRDGGEAGLHPSNIHDNAYCVGSVDFTGDMPILLGPDGPSLGGFVCPAVVARADLWKMGQLCPGDTVRFHGVSVAEAEQLLEIQESALAAGCGDASVPGGGRRGPVDSPVMEHIEERQVVFRQSGDGVILVEFGEAELDLDLRCRVQSLLDRLSGDPFAGMLEVVPGIRSLQVQFDPTIISGRRVLDRIAAEEADLPPVEEMEFASRIVHLPLSWDDPATRLAIEKYTQIVRPDAPWCPSNIEFIRRINGLESIEEVQRIVFEASYLVMGLGDVYLGAPVATPLDPRHRLVTTKYNPARTWTPENAVGIGGAYLCIYGMEGPGGYQFVGRTLPVWNRFRVTPAFSPGRPWLLRFFDQIRWYPVEAEELLEQRRDFLAGRLDLRIEDTVFRPREYRRFLENNADSITSFRTRQREAFARERQQWEESGTMTFGQAEADAGLACGQDDERALPPDGVPVTSPVSGGVWKILVALGDLVNIDQPLLILESMKTEISITAPGAARVRDILVKEGAGVRAGQMVMVLEPEERP